MVEALLEQAPWLTPLTLFLLLNVVIATILLSSSFSAHRKPAVAPPQNPPQFARTPSLFSRVTSFNLSNYHYDDDDNHQHHQLRHNHSSPSLLSRVTSFKLSGRANEPDPDESVTREEVKEVRKMVARAPSFLSRVASFPLGKREPHVEVSEVNANDDGNNIPKAKKGKKKTKKVVKDEEEVDAKADDFINKFKQQLKLQRLDSLMRYRSA